MAVGMVEAILHNPQARLRVDIWRCSDCGEDNLQRRIRCNACQLPTRARIVDFSTAPSILRVGVLHITVPTLKGLLPALEVDLRGVRPYHTHAVADAGPLSDQLHCLLSSIVDARYVSGTRINLYAAGEGKPKHHDRHGFDLAAGNLAVLFSV
eukprot:6625718-Karenia_brevis.AAC.1